MYIIIQVNTPVSLVDALAPRSPEQDQQHW